MALADKIDTLVGFWAIDEKPTGSKDPYALRRAALGVIRLIVDNKLRTRLEKVVLNAIDGLAPVDDNGRRWIWGYAPNSPLSQRHRDSGAAGSPQSFVGNDAALIAQLLAFFADRLKVQLRDQGARHDLVDAVFSLGGQDDLLMVVRRVEALGKFLETDDGKNLLAGTKRASNILSIEEKKDKRSFDGAPDAGLYKLPEEKALAKAIDQVKGEAETAVAKGRFRRRHERDGEAAPGGRCVLRQGQGE